ncbi:MAG TPA: phosphatase PAP2 family protein, partial [Clostridiales bacterium]|nr:phosphatase PAP2 family protein [Clostridiales bacterium]
MDFITSLDWRIFQFFEEYLWNPVLNVIMTVITTLGDGGIIWIVCAICLLITKKYRKVGAMVACGLIFSLIFTDAVFKPLIERVRPFNFDGWPAEFVFPDLVERPQSLSFPSGHTSSSFAAAVPMLLGCKKQIGIPAVIFAF